MHLVVCGPPAQLLRRHRLEHLRRGGWDTRQLVGREDRAGQPGRPARDEPDLRRCDLQLRADLQAHPDARVAPVVHRVVDQPDMPAHRDPLPRRVQVGLGGHRVLLVAELVAGVGEQLHQGHSQIGDVALGPLRREQGEPVEQQLTEAGVVLGEVVQRGLGEPGRRAWRWQAIGLARAASGEGERGRGLPWVQARIGQVRSGGGQPQGVGRGISRCFERNGQRGGRILTSWPRPGDLHRPAAGDDDIGDADARRDRAGEEKGERDAAVGADLHVHLVQGGQPGRLQGRVAARGPADQPGCRGRPGGHGVPPGVSVTVWCWPVPVTV